MASTRSIPSRPPTGGVRWRREDPRPVRTRAALVEAAQRLLADGGGELSVAQITRAAGVGLGSFYNHFHAKSDLFEAAVTDALRAHGDRVRALNGAVQDPVEVFCVGLRLSGRWQRSHPQLARVLVNTAMARLLGDRGGLLADARQDLAAAVGTGRFDMADVDLDLALDLAASSLIALFVRLDAHPAADAGALADVCAAHVLRGLGMSGDAARRLVARPLPEPRAEHTLLP